MAHRKKLPRTFEKYEAALSKLRESLSAEFGEKYTDKDVLIEIVVKRFEYTFECMWKTLKEMLLAEGVECATPLSAFKGAFKMGVIEDQYEEVFSLMVKKRNEIVHIYSNEDAKEIYLLIKNVFIDAIESTYRKIEAAAKQ